MGAVGQELALARNNVNVVKQVVNKVPLPEKSNFFGDAKLISSIAIPIIVAVVLFTVIPFVSGVGAPIGLALTGLFCIAVGVYFLLTGEGLAKFKAWGEKQEALAKEAKQKQNVEPIEPVKQQNAASVR
jgi:hypothetical protein